MKLLLRWLAFVVVACVLGLAGLGVYLATADLGRHKDRLTPLISEALGRELRIDGPLSLRLGRTVHIRATDVALANADWADGASMLEADSLIAAVDLRSLLDGPPRIDTIRLEGAIIRLQETADGRGNWSELARGGDAAGGAPPEVGALPRIARFAARDVRIVVITPALTAPTEVAIDAAELALDEEGLAATVSATVNGVPLSIESVAGPAERLAAMEDLDVSVEAALGEVTLSGRARVSDVRALAIASAEITLNGPDADYLLGVLNLRPITSGPIGLEMQLVPDPERSDFRATGYLGEYRFAAEGWVEDLRAAGGFDTRLEIAGPDLALLGRRLAIDGLPALAFRADGRVRGREGRLEIEGADITVGKERLRADVGIVSRERGGNTLSVNARYRGIAGRLDAVTRTGLSPEGAAFDFRAQGPDAGAAGRRLGVEGLPALPFTASGRGEYRTGNTTLESGELRLGEQRIGFTGRASLAAAGATANVRFDARDLDLSHWLPPVEPLNPSLSTVSGTGRLRFADGRLELDELSLAAGAATLQGALALPLAQRGDNGRFELQIRAPSAAAISPALDRFPLAGGALDAGGRGEWGPDGWEIRGAVLRLPELGTLSGDASYKAGDRPFVTAKLKAERLDLPTRAEDDQQTGPTADGRVIPPLPLPFDRLAGFDADLALTVDALHSAAIAGARLGLRATLRDGILNLEELETDGNRGRLRAAFTAAPAGDAYTVRLDLAGQALRIAPPEETEGELAARPAYELDAALEARGRDLRELADTLNGRIRIQSGPGRIPRRAGLLSTLVFEDFLSRTLETVNPLVRERDGMELNCLVLRLDIEDGTASGDPLFALQTKEFNLLARGRIDLGTESLDMDIAAQPRRGLGISLGDLLNPFTRVGGTLATPRIVADPKSGAIETGAGIATGGLWPLAKKLRDRFLGGNPCAKALEGDRAEANR